MEIPGVRHRYGVACDLLYYPRVRRCGSLRELIDMHRVSRKGAADVVLCKLCSCLLCWCADGGKDVSSCDSVLAICNTSRRFREKHTVSVLEV